MRRGAGIGLGHGRPRYALLAQAILRDIESGRYPVGSLLPTEIEFAEQFGMSRHTVREAIRKLREIGLVSRQQGVGTRVKASSAAARYVQSLTSISGLFQYAKEVRLTVTATHEVVADDVLARLLRCKPGQRWLKIEGLRHAERQALPICHTEVFINYAFAGIRKFIGRAQVPLYTLIEKHYGERPHEIQQEIVALAVPAAMARALRVKAGTPGLSIVRHYLAADERTLEVAVNVYPAERFSYSMRLRLDANSGAGGE